MATFNINVDADSTTPRMLKKLKKDLSPNSSLNFLSPIQMNGGNQLSQSSNITIHPALPKKKLKNGHSERSLMASSASFQINSISNGSSNSPQSMLRSSNGYNSPTPSSPHNSTTTTASGSTSSNLNVPLSQLNVSHVSNNIRIQNSKQDLRDRLVQFCFQELVPLKSVNSETFRAILQSHLRLCTTQLHQQLLQQQQQHPQLMSLTSMISSFMNHLSHQMPDSEQLRNYLETLYIQCRDRIRQDIATTLEYSAGGALVCDSEHDACIISTYYVDSDWRLVEAILSASALVFDINQFVSKTLESYNLQEKKKLSKLTFVSHGGLFDGVSVCLSSMAHIVDKVVDEAISSVEELSQQRKFPPLSDLFDTCQELASKLSITIEPLAYDVDWIAKYELMKVLQEQSSQLVEDEPVSSLVNFDLVNRLVALLEPFRTASHELRQCFKHPTLCHVLLYFHKLKKVLAVSQPAAKSTAKSLELKATKQNGHSVKKDPEAKSYSSGVESDSDLEEEKDDDKTEMRKEEDENDEEECKNVDGLMDHLKEQLMANLKRHYEVQSLHRIATFLWPNFRLLKMMSADEQKEVHEDVRKLIQSRVLAISLANGGASGGGGGASGNLNSNGESEDSSDQPVNGIGVVSKTKSKLDFDEWEVLSDQDQDEVDKYLSVQLTSCSEHYVLQWWREHQNEFPKLSQLAKWILSIPASVTTRERFKISNNRQMDDFLLFLHCNM